MFTEIVGDTDGILDRVGIRAAVTNNRYSFDTQQRRAAVFGIIQTPPEGPERFFREDIADLRRQRFLEFLAEHSAEGFDETLAQF